MTTKNKINRTDCIKFIHDNLNRLLLDELRGVGQILVNAGLWNHIVEKGSGTQIQVKYIPDDTILSIYTYTKNKIDEKTVADNSEDENENENESKD
jgi:hypothetical protein